MRLDTIQSSMYKRAGIKGELASNYAQGAIGYIPSPLAMVPSLVNGAGGIVGAFSPAASEAEEKKWDEGGEELLGLVPGVNAYRLNRRIKRQTKDDKGGNAHFWSQRFGGLSAALLAMAALGVAGGAIGGGIGAAVNGKEGLGVGLAGGAGIGAALGGTGALLSEVGASIAAGVNPRRTKKEQRDYANSGTAKEWLIPGVGQYNMWKSLGRAIGDSEEREAAKAAAGAAAPAMA